MRRALRSDPRLDLEFRAEESAVAVLAHGSGRPYRVSLHGTIRRELVGLLVASGRFSLAVAPAAEPRRAAAGSTHVTQN